VTLISAKFSKDLFSISKVIGRKTKWPPVFGLPCIARNVCYRPCVRPSARQTGVS